MSYLPKDPAMLLSFVNTKLRDEFSSLDEFCNMYNCPKEDITESLKSIDYTYDDHLNQFK